MVRAIGQTAVMHRNRLALTVVVIAGLIATGCGSDDTESDSGKAPEGAQVENEAPKNDEPKNDEPTGKSARAQMTECIEGELGFDVSSDESADDDAHNLSVKSSDGKLQASVIVHPDVGAARKSTAQTLNKGLNAVPFGRVEFIRRAANDTEAGVIANCVAVEYNRPRR
ncbi:MAG TPA: hypothetical protein VGV67_03980 [Solirubrobacteraceae bacterium]|nr:hypothetical protein [Solirubrobacteraceae bacterium]